VAYALECLVQHANAVLKATQKQSDLMSQYELCLKLLGDDALQIDRKFERIIDAHLQIGLKQYAFFHSIPRMFFM
jgi:hypothetical protein